MKKGLIYLFAFLTLSAMVTGCKKDDDCAAPTLSSNIVGTWTATWESGDAEFKANGELIDPNDIIIGGEVNGVVLDEKSYTVSGDTLLSVRAESGSQFVTADFDVIANECDEITLSVFGISAKLNRK